jgi:hypothetical protein
MRGAVLFGARGDGSHGEPAGGGSTGWRARALLIDTIVTAHRGGEDGPFELFLANGVYQRGSGWGQAFEGRFEARDDAGCVRGENSAPSCRRVLANADGTYTFIDTADGTSAVMIVSRRR